jgi:hypothetical protein
MALAALMAPAVCAQITSPAEIEITAITTSGPNVTAEPSRGAKSLLGFEFTLTYGTARRTTRGQISVLTPQGTPVDRGTALEFADGSVTVRVSWDSQILFTPQVRVDGATCGDVAGGEAICRFPRLNVEAKPEGRYATLTARVALGFRNVLGASDSDFANYEMKASYEWERGSNDFIRILAVQPEPAATLEATTTPPIFAFIEYSLTSEDSAEVFLELRVVPPDAGQNGFVLAFSNPRLVRRGSGRVGAGTGDDPFLKIDPADLTVVAAGATLELRAWIGQRGGGPRLAGTTPIMYPLRRPGGLNLELGRWNGASFNPIDPARTFLLAGRDPKTLHPEIAVRVTSQDHKLESDNVSVGHIGKGSDGRLRFLFRDPPEVIGDSEAVLPFRYRALQEDVAFLFQARLVTPAGQVILSRPVEVPVEGLVGEASKVVPSPRDGALVKGTKAQAFSVPVQATVQRSDSRLIRCVTFSIMGLPGFQDCVEASSVLQPRRIRYTDTFHMDIPEEASRAEFQYFLAPSKDAPPDQRADAFGLEYAIKGPPTLVQAGADRLVSFTKGAIEKINATTDRVVNVEGPRAKTALWAADTYKVIFGKDPADGKSRSAAATPGEVIAARLSWRFDPPIPADGSFTGEMTLRYDPEDLPDDPNFDEAKIEILAIRPETGEIERLAGRADTTARSVTACVDGLASIYTLGVVTARERANFAFPAAAASSSAQSGLALVNLSGETAAPELTAYSEHGEPATVGPVGTELRPWAQWSGAASDLLKPDGPVSWVLVRAAGNRIAGVNLLAAGSKLEAIPLATSASRYSVLARVEWNADLETELRIVNPGNFETELSVFLYAPDGSEQAKAALTLRAQSERRMDVRGLFPDAPETFLGHLQISSEEPVVATATHLFGRAMAVSTAQPISDASIDATALYAPVAGTDVSLYLVHKGADTARITMRLFQDSGEPLRSEVIELASGAQYSAGLGTEFRVELPAGRTGWLLIESDRGGVVGEIHFGDTFAGRFRSSLPLVRSLLKSAVIPFAEHHGQTTGTLVVVSPGVASSVRVTAVNRDGTPRGSNTVALGANRRVANPLSQWVPQAAGFDGYLLIESDQPVFGYQVLSPVSGTDYAVIAMSSSPGGGPTGSASAPLERITPLTARG